jgi:multiple sugar transport system permease protein
LIESAAKNRKSRIYRKEKAVAVLFILLPMIGFSIFTVGTMFMSAVYGFQDFRGIDSGARWVGLKNYSDLFTSLMYAENFVRSVTTTLWLLLGVPVGMAAGLFIAQLLNNKRLKGKSFFRMLLYLPAVTGAVALNIVWRYIFNPEFGLAGFIFGHDVAWLSDRVMLKIAIIIKGVWSGLGGTMLLYLAGMQNISGTYYEAAEIDGASGPVKFFRITLPMLTPVTFYLLVTGIIGGLQSYADSQVFAAGHRHAQTIVFFIWRYGIGDANYGLASAASLLLAVVIMIVTVVQFRLSQKWVYED